MSSEAENRLRLVAIFTMKKKYELFLILTGIISLPYCSGDCKGQLLQLELENGKAGSLMDGK
ncbi:hypothetical protein [Pedobacter psychrodurus]|uniref:hypothetical protein n=1 Tax=Pedobacter psychrodurus TaxID=2530456 RepID=UPI0029304A41|nr:hypothetical protein [Pedobacter psychrodurus]